MRGIDSAVRIENGDGAFVFREIVKKGRIKSRKKSKKLEK